MEGRFVKRNMVFLTISVLFLTACGQTRSHSPAVIIASKLELSSVSEQTAESVSNQPLSVISPAKSGSSAAASPRKSSAVPSETGSAASSAASPEASSGKTSSGQNSAASFAVPYITSGQGLEVISLTSPIVRGQDASVTVKGKPDVEYTIKVIYKSGPSTAKGLEPKISERDGAVTWRWKVSAKTTAGDWHIEISGGGAEISLPFVVTE